MKKVKLLFVALVIGLSFSLGSCAEEVVFPDGEDTTTKPVGDPDC